MSPYGDTRLNCRIATAMFTFCIAVSMDMATVWSLVRHRMLAQMIPIMYPENPRQAGATKCCQEMTKIKNLLAYIPSVVYITINTMNIGRQIFVNFAPRVGFLYVISIPRNMGRTNDSRERKSCRYGKPMLVSETRTNVPNNQIQKVVQAKLATLLQNVMVTDRFTSPFHMAEIESDLSEFR